MAHLQNGYILSYSLTVPSGTPGSIDAQPIDSRTLLLAWEPPAEEEQNGIIREYFNISAAETSDEFQYRATNTTVIVEDLHPHYTYSFVISAVTIGPGPYSEAYTIQMPEDGKTLNTLHILCLCLLQCVYVICDFSQQLPQLLLKMLPCKLLVPEQF